MDKKLQKCSDFADLDKNGSNFADRDKKPLHIHIGTKSHLDFAERDKKPFRFCRLGQKAAHHFLGTVSEDNVFQAQTDWCNK